MISMCTSNFWQGLCLPRNRVEVPSFAIADAVWTWVLKMFQEAQRSLAPRAANVSMSTLVWVFTWNEAFMIFTSSLVTV